MKSHEKVSGMWRNGLDWIETLALVQGEESLCCRVMMGSMCVVEYDH